MYCKNCGCKLSEDNVRFCSHCGKKLTETETDNENITVNSNNTDSTVKLDFVKIKFICSNIGLIIIYFMDWIKIKDTDELPGFLSYAETSIESSLSPKYIIDLLNQVKSWVAYGNNYGLDIRIPVYYNLLYLLIGIPILGAVSIALLLFKKDGLSKIFCLIAGTLVIFTAIGAFLLAFDENIGTEYGVFIAFAAGALAIIFADDIYDNNEELVLENNFNPKGNFILKPEYIEEDFNDHNFEMNIISNNKRFVICGYCGYESNEYGQKICGQCGNKLYYNSDDDEIPEKENEG